MTEVLTRPRHGVNSSPEVESGRVSLHENDEPLSTDLAEREKRTVRESLAEPFALAGNAPTLSVFDGMLVGFLGGSLGGFIVGGAAASGGLDIALDVEFGAVVGILLGMFVVMVGALGSRLVRRRPPAHH